MHLVGYFEVGLRKSLSDRLSAPARRGNLQPKAALLWMLHPDVDLLLVLILPPGPGPDPTSSTGC